MVKVVWTNFATDDLKQIHDFISQDSRVYADRIINQIIERTDQLSGFPLSGRSVPEFQTETLRELVFGRYRIIYKVFPENITIIRIHHSSRWL
jgi:toxin ParE1/3/4